MMNHITEKNIVGEIYRNVYAVHLKQKFNDKIGKTNLICNTICCRNGGVCRKYTYLIYRLLRPVRITINMCQRCLYFAGIELQYDITKNWLFALHKKLFYNTKMFRTAFIPVVRGSFNNSIPANSHSHCIPFMIYFNMSDANVNRTPTRRNNYRILCVRIY